MGVTRSVSVRSVDEFQFMPSLSMSRWRARVSGRLGLSMISPSANVKTLMPREPTSRTSASEDEKPPA